MTDEERQQLILELRTTSIDPRLLIKAADEIDRLSKENKELRECAELWRRRND